MDKNIKDLREETKERERERGREREREAKSKVERVEGIERRIRGNRDRRKLEEQGKAMLKKENRERRGRENRGRKTETRENIERK